MNFTFYDDFVRYSLEESDEKLYMAFMSTPQSELHFFANNIYCGSLSFADYKSSQYHFSKTLLKNLLYRVTTFEDVVDYSRIFSLYQSNSIILADQFGNFRELSILGLKRMDFDTRKKIEVLPYLANVKDKIRVLCKNKRIGFLMFEEDLMFLDGEFSCFSSLSEVSKFELVVDCCLKKSEHKRLKREFKHIVSAEDFYVELIIENFLALLQKNSIYLSIVDVPDEESYELNGDEISALHFKTNIVGAFNNQSYLNAVFDAKEEMEYISHTGTNIYSSYSIKETPRFRYVQASNCDRVSVSNGVRNYSPRNCYNAIRLFGPCIAYGLFSSDRSTISAYIDRLCAGSGLDYDVINHGVPDGNDLINDLELMLNQVYHSGDHIIWINHFDSSIKACLSKFNVPYHNMRDIMRGEHYWFLNHPMHCNYRANYRIASSVMHDIAKPNQANGELISIFLKEFDFALDKTLKYKSALEEEILTKRREGINGAIVINCNPFTRGHLYLAELASKEVDNLYVFVVENNSRAIPFYYRYNMAQKACENLHNVVVLRTGEYFASENTFSAYFNGNNADVDPYEDIEIFSQSIAPILGIKKRFFGTEKSGSVTFEFNEICQKELKKYGVETIIVPRKTANDEHISASNVRKILKEKEYSKLESLVPPYTREILVLLQN